MASLQQRPRLFWLASPRTGLQMQLHAQRKILSNCCIAGDQNRKSNDHRRTTNLNRRKTSPTGTSFFCFFVFVLHLMGSRNHPPPARLQSRGGKAAPVTSLSDPSPTRPTPVKLEPRPLPAALSSLPNPDSCQPPVGAPRRWGTGRVPTPAGTRSPAETRPRLDAAAPVDAPSGRPSCAPPAAASRLAHLARGRSSGPLSCSGSSSGGGGGGGGGGSAAAAAAAALRGVLGGMTPSQGRRRRTLEEVRGGRTRARRARPVLCRLPLQK